MRQKEGKGEPEDEEFENIDPDSPGDISEFSESELGQIKKDFKKQQDMLKHDYRDIKEQVSNSEKSLLDVIEKAGIVIVPTGRGINKGELGVPAVDCIVVNQLSRELIMAGASVFPMSTVNNSIGADKDKPPVDNDEAVAKGVALGRLLGKKLQVRGEVNIIKFIRKRSGKIERRLLAGIGAGLEDIFNRSVVNRYNAARLHISVDASSSMASPEKWHPTITCLVAICVACSMVDNLKISVSFRCTHRLKDGTELPYVVLAYDSEQDKISKVRNLFPYLRANGCTPEGLADRQFWRDIWYRSYKEFFSKTDKKFIRIASSIDGTRLLEFTREDFLTFEDPSVIIESKRKFEAERAKIAASLDARLAVMEANPNSHKISLNYMRRKILKLQGMTRADIQVICPYEPDEMDARNIVKLLNENDMKAATIRDMNQDHMTYLVVFQSAMDTEAKQVAIEMRKQAYIQSGQGQAKDV